MVIRDWSHEVVFSAKGPQPRLFAEDETLQVYLIGLEPRQKVPDQPAPERGGVYHILQGRGWMRLGDRHIAVTEGMTVIAPTGAKRDVQAETRLVLLAALATA